MNQISIQCCKNVRFLKFFFGYTHLIMSARFLMPRKGFTCFICQYNCQITSEHGRILNKNSTKRIFLALNGILRSSMVYYGVVWHTTAYYGVLRHTMRTTAYYGVLRHTTAYYAVLRRTTAYHGVLRRTTAYHGLLRRTTVYQRTTAYLSIL